LLAHDLDVAEEIAGGQSAAFKVQVAGPWTLAATVERSRGDKVLADHGARRDLGQALAEGIRAHCADVRRRIGPEKLFVQIDEPGLPAVLSGDVPTASGFSRHRAVSSQEAAESLTWAADAVSESGAVPVLHCCARDLPFDVLTRVPLKGLSFDLTTIPSSQYEDLGAWVESGREAWLGAVPATDPHGAEPTATELTKQVLRWWARVGYQEPESMPDTVVTPGCGLVGASPHWARAALGRCQEIARNLSAEQGKIGP
jgi:hypothetical protein